MVGQNTSPLETTIPRYCGLKEKLSRKKEIGPRLKTVFSKLLGIKKKKLE
jgi:uncharacterized protein (DUF2342 family)